MKLLVLALFYPLVLRAYPAKDQYIFSALEHVDEQNWAVGKQAAQAFTKLVAAGHIYESSIQYCVADRHLRPEKLSKLWRKAEAALNPVDGKVDTSLLGFGRLPGFAKSRRRLFKKREALVAKLRSGLPMTDDAVFMELVSPQDIRPLCEQWKDVAQVFAQALFWDRALGLVQSKGCVDRDLGDQYTLRFLQAARNPKAETLAQVAYHASLIGYFSMGVKSGFSPQDKHKVQPVIDFATSLLSYQHESVELQAAIVSLVEKVTEKFSKTEPTAAAIVSSEVRQSFERLIPALNQVDSLKVDFKPVIEQAVKEWKKAVINPHEPIEERKTPYYMYAQALHQYYLKYKDPWQAWLWLQEAYATRPASGHNADWTRDCYSLIHRRAAVAAYHLLGKNQNGKDALQVMSEKLAGWDGRPIPRPTYQTYHQHIREPEYLKQSNQIQRPTVEVGKLDRNRMNVWDQRSVQDNRNMWDQRPAPDAQIAANPNSGNQLLQQPRKLGNRLNFWKQQEQLNRVR
ncbi:hypothetical protein PSACC_03186 [Paramicrosporidium saccamoebae]|uniref:Uncharacterized protein n=1 Tax=Paramicrosporidium saccamoebae TaxID=1246581 RepID=A0A2H9TGU5_9FUNG|nr:hypothetical protein PSACC_03186 [Paramicrosporidium saccamoebae]